MHISFFSLCAELGNSAWQWFDTHTQEYISFGLLHASSAASHVCNPFPWLLHLLPLFHVCPSPPPFFALSSEEASMRYFQKRAQLTRHRWKRAIWNRGLSRLDYLIGNSIHIYVPYYIQIYKYIHTHVLPGKWEKCDIIYCMRWL